MGLRVIFKPKFSSQTRPGTSDNHSPNRRILAWKSSTCYKDPFAASENNKSGIFSARQRSCGKVMFSQVFVCPRGVSLSRRVHGRFRKKEKYPSRGVLCRWYLSRGGCGGGLRPGVSVRETPLYGKERAVRILLECILVLWCCHLMLQFTSQSALCSEVIDLR